MSEAAQRCPVCDTAIPAGDERCPGCGKVFGETNRCPSCHAIAAVSEVARGRYICAACSAPRKLLPGTAIDSDFADELKRRSSRDRVLAIVFWAVGIPLTIAGGVILGLGQGLLEGAWQVALTALGAPMLALGLGGMWFARRLGKGSRDMRARALDARLVLAAERSRRGVTAADAASQLLLRTGEADQALTRLAKEGRVALDVDDEGVIRYRVADPERESLVGDTAATDHELRTKT